MQVEVAQRGRERVGVVDHERGAFRVADLEPVAERELDALELALEETGRVRLHQLDRVRALDTHAHALGLRAERAHHDPAVLRVGPEQAVRVGQPALDELVDSAHASASSSLTIPATGMRTQSGRLSSS